MTRYPCYSVRFRLERAVSISKPYRVVLIIEAATTRTVGNA